MKRVNKYLVNVKNIKTTQVIVDATSKVTAIEKVKDIYEEYPSDRENDVYKQKNKSYKVIKID